MISPLNLFIAQSDSGLKKQDEQRAKQAGFVSWPHLLSSTDLSGTGAGAVAQTSCLQL